MPITVDFGPNPAPGATSWNPSFYAPNELVVATQRALGVAQDGIWSDAFNKAVADKLRARATELGSYATTEAEYLDRLAEEQGLITERAAMAAVASTHTSGVRPRTITGWQPFRYGTMAPGEQPGATDGGAGRQQSDVQRTDNAGSGATGDRILGMPRNVAIIGGAVIGGVVLVGLGALLIKQLRD
jgi:hypothetical protein